MVFEVNRVCFSQMSSNASAASMLGQAFLNSRNGQPELVLLEAAAGFGKSHAFRDFASQVKQGLVFCLPSQAWLATMLRVCYSHLEGERDPAFLEAARRVVPELPWAKVAQAAHLTDQNSLSNALAHALERLAKRVGGLVLLLEDWHEASNDDLNSLRVLYRRALMGQTPMLFGLNARPMPNDLLEGFGQDAAIMVKKITPKLR